MSTNAYTDLSDISLLEASARYVLVPQSCPFHHLAVLTACLKGFGLSKTARKPSNIDFTRSPCELLLEVV